MEKDLERRLKKDYLMNEIDNDTARHTEQELVQKDKDSERQTCKETDGQRHRERYREVEKKPEKGGIRRSLRKRSSRNCESAETPRTRGAAGSRRIRDSLRPPAAQSEGRAAQPQGLPRLLRSNDARVLAGTRQADTHANS
ncbi:hypothetical protein RRG08_050947 [Elysia crispata]|uniref:Uncharacterized protein n=1 Tax=Elysia crispata TaxID=231223 RepID=A0AAE1D3K7_9GAST|nr:hypothetical protein RRG08_050947 [Elysia crispata]